MFEDVASMEMQDARLAEKEDEKEGERLVFEKVALLEMQDARLAEKEDEKEGEKQGDC